MILFFQNLLDVWCGSALFWRAHPFLREASHIGAQSKKSFCENTRRACHSTEKEYFLKMSHETRPRLLKRIVFHSLSECVRLPCSHVFLTMQLEPPKICPAMHMLHIVTIGSWKGRLLIGREGKR